MTHSVLLVLNDGFDDMMFLSSQVVLEEKGCDVIICSDTSKTVKGESSSVMTVSLEDALAQDVDYSALIVVGGDNLQNWDLLKSTVSDFFSKGKIIATVSSMKEILVNGGISLPNSDAPISNENNLYLLNDLSKCEEFVELIAKGL